MKPLRNFTLALTLIITLLAVTLPARANDNQLTRGEKLPTGEYRVGGAVTAPREVYAPDPEYTDEARKANYQGTVVLWLVVDANGRPQQIRVQRPLGMGLDEKAIEAVRQWKFEPARKDGQAVPAMINLEITFRRFTNQQSTLVSTRPAQNRISSLVLTA